MLFHIAKLAQGTDTAFRSKIQLKYHLWKEKTFFLTVWRICVCVYIYMYIYIIIVLTKDNHIFTHPHPSLGL